MKRETVTAADVLLLVAVFITLAVWLGRLP